MINSWTFLVTQNDTTTCPAVIDQKMNDPWPWIWDCLNSTNNSVTTILSGELWWPVGCSAFKSFWYSLFCSWPCCKCCCFLGCCDLLGCCIGGIKISTMPIWKILRIIQVISVTSLSPMALIIVLSYIASENKIRVPVPVLVPAVYLHITLVIFFLLTGWIFLPFLHVKVQTFILNRPPLRLTYLQFWLKSWLSSSGDILAQFSHRQICLLHLNPFQFETHLDARFWSRSVFRRWWPSSHFESLQVEPAQLYLDYFWKFSESTRSCMKNFFYKLLSQRFRIVWSKYGTKQICMHEPTHESYLLQILQWIKNGPISYLVKFLNSFKIIPRSLFDHWSLSVDRERHCTFGMDVLPGAFGHRLKNILDLVSDVYAVMSVREAESIDGLPMPASQLPISAPISVLFIDIFIRSEILQNFRKSNFFSFLSSL